VSCPNDPGAAIICGTNPNGIQILDASGHFASNPGTLKGTAIVIDSKGRYAGAKGDGTFEGRTIQSSGEGIAYIDNVINIKK
jgi:hypothetical protein